MGALPTLLLPRIEFNQIAGRIGHCLIRWHPESIFAQNSDSRCSAKIKKQLKERNTLAANHHQDLSLIFCIILPCQSAHIRR